MSAFKLSYSALGFIQATLKKHKRVASVMKENHYYYVIERTEGKTTVRCAFVDLYTIGVADIVTAMEEFPGLNCLVTVGDWNAYTPEAKDYGLANDIGVFQSSEFFGALWRDDFQNYVKTDDRGNALYSYRSA